jgi:tousled-like kinase
LKYLHHPSSFDSFEAGSTSSSSRKSIIHYDLKPANILFDEMGDAKITDFGLSKLIDASSEGTSVELTSQGAGTYWYLPPECFDDNPRISTKVDVWSVGVILYQMLFGKKPFGEGRSQERILSEGIIRNVSQVEIPDQPKVSEEAKDFVRICLTPNPTLRPDVNELCGHAYIRPA